MSDFTDYNFDKETAEEEFDDYAHLKELCISLQIQLKDPEVDYGRGWTELINEMLTPLKGSAIFLISITSTYGQLDTQFFISKGVRASRVYSAAERARIRSRETCMQCGNAGSRKVHGDKVIVICRKCQIVKDNNGDTGTWLDRY